MAVEKKKDKISATVDQEPAETLQVPNKLDVVMPLYVGGPETPDVFTNNSVDLVKHSIRGCIRNFVVVGKDIEMQDHKVVRDVSRCFKTVEAGISFEQNAWGSVRDSFEIVPQYSIQLDFRTTGENGVLMSSVSTDEKSGFSLELHEGQIKLSLLQDSKMTTIETTNPSQFEYCRNSWHSVSAAFDNDKLILSVDNGKQESKDVQGGIQQIKIDSPLFLGGFPTGFTSKSSLTQESFVGCIRNVVLNKKAVDWYKDVVNSSNIRRTACPL